MNYTEEEKYIAEIFDDDNKSEIEKIEEVMVYLRYLCRMNIIKSDERWRRMDYDITVGLLCMADGHVGCIKKDDDWYCYHTYERNEVEICGPFTPMGVVKAMMWSLGLETDLKLLGFTEKEFLVYFNTLYTLEEFKEL